MLIASTTLATINTQPYFERALRFGLEHGIITEPRLQSIISEGATGTVQIANYFGTAHLRTDLENAKERMVNLISLYLEDFSEGDLRTAAISLRDKSLPAHSKGGSDMLRRLHALPEDYFIDLALTIDSQKDFLNDKSLSSAMALAEFRVEMKFRQEKKLKINLALWLAKKLGTTDAQSLSHEAAESVINSAMLVVLTKQAKQQLPSPSEMVKLVSADRKKPIKLEVAKLNALLAEAPRELHKIGQQEMERFVATYTLKIRHSDQSIDALVREGFFFLASSYDQSDLKEYEKTVAKEWHKLTNGEDDDHIFSTILLFVATGFKPKSSMLLRESKEVIAAFRTSGFDTVTVIKFIEDYAPHEKCEDLKRLLKELEADCSVYLVDNDPQMPDKYMDRALNHLKSICHVQWKGRGR